MYLKRSPKRKYVLKRLPEEEICIKKELQKTKYVLRRSLIRGNMY